MNDSFQGVILTAIGLIIGSLMISSVFVQIESGQKELEI
jgi:hypothetical protein